MAFPTNNVHRRNRRNLGHGQNVPQPTVTVTVAASPNTNSATLTFSAPVVITGATAVGLAIAASFGATVSATTMLSPTTYQITYIPGTNSTLVGKTWTLPTPLPNVQTYQGGGVTGGAGTF